MARITATGQGRCRTTRPCCLRRTWLTRRLVVARDDYGSVWVAPRPSWGARRLPRGHGSDVCAPVRSLGPDRGADASDGRRSRPSGPHPGGRFELPWRRRPRCGRTLTRPSAPWTPMRGSPWFRLQPRTVRARRQHGAGPRGAGTAATSRARRRARRPGRARPRAASDVGDDQSELDPGEIDAFTRPSQAALGGVTLSRETETLASGQFVMPTGASTRAGGSRPDRFRRSEVASAIRSPPGSRGWSVVCGDDRRPLRSSTTPGSRPLVEVRRLRGVRRPARSCWVDAPGGTISYTYTERRSGERRADRAGRPPRDTASSGCRTALRDGQSVRGADGVERWHADAS